MFLPCSLTKFALSSSAKSLMPAHLAKARKSFQSFDAFPAKRIIWENALSPLKGLPILANSRMYGVMRSFSAVGDNRLAS